MPPSPPLPRRPPSSPSAAAKLASRAYAELAAAALASCRRRRLAVTPLPARRRPLFRLGCLALLPPPPSSHPVPLPSSPPAAAASGHTVDPSSRRRRAHLPPSWLSRLALVAALAARTSRCVAVVLAWRGVTRPSFGRSPGSPELWAAASGGIFPSSPPYPTFAQQLNN